MQWTKKIQNYIYYYSYSSLTIYTNFTLVTVENLLLLQDLIFNRVRLKFPLTEATLASVCDSHYGVETTFKGRTYIQYNSIDDPYAVPYK